MEERQQKASVLGLVIAMVTFTVLVSILVPRVIPVCSQLGCLP